MIYAPSRFGALQMLKDERNGFDRISDNEISLTCEQLPPHERILWIR